MSKRLLVVAGGTGGHIFPGIAVANELKSQGWEVSWIGTADRMESEVVPKHGIDIDFIRVQGLRGNGVKRLIKAPFLVIKAVLDARKVIKARRPDVVLAMGGYVTGPVGIAARSLAVPLIIHEQNAVAGLSNRLLAKIADVVLSAFPSAFKTAHSKVVGNPVRASVSQLQPKQTVQQINCLVMGGSLGAKVLNDTLPDVFAKLQTKTELPLLVKHQSGKGESSTLQYRYDNAGVTAEAVDFIDDIDKAYEWADIVICRSGALTVSEVAAAGKMALFIPYPHAVDDHQTANANYLVKGEAALIMPQSQFESAAIIKMLLPFILQPHLITEVAKKAKNLAELDATRSVAQECVQLSR
ncbi:undecaprenyldiphospho-muramoylpentapeptide beta-N-acetylglucosaminyltransferase [Pseudoalteromonas aurantia]|uniref:UDP-N-acetylglucosamine--N-acetylmuramyl-(pentapeptide) pyrophosphoryl-undecaprenol N-acetylglucosamine transferase n=1 Tax=Pseudoalteromonas aurantia 208 TaxID=1314867 RepID=A0ABR9EGG9_9GAMM|nr:undecaprenyldiphospho-muramoylpentapeptide beta-N-acetylglucosaminyltransferase [Pseudoalteromonas aurantia]MBE0369320.1 UDP-N-acetylglucosamine--N-acetylmuramyl-(pentapeptide) pyrophosphoryl-undecaprenol N-acetylglucosamine transferase [Pseudoalteromonas aurantia 208]